MTDLGNDMRLMELRKENARAWAEVERLRERVSEAESSLYAWDNERRASYWHLYPTPIDTTLKDVDWRFAIDPTLTTLHRDSRSDCT